MIDLKAFGIDGVRPAQMNTLADMTKDTEPAVWELLHGGDPLVERILSDPRAGLNLYQEGLDALAPEGVGAQ